MAEQTTGIYLHMPFCAYLCPYCDFAKEPWRASREQRYLSALQRDIAQAPQSRAQTLFIGGGTPNMTAPQLLIARIEQVREHFHLPDQAEISVECNPDGEHIQGLEAYVAAGVNRISIGAQSFVPAELAALGRRHSPDDVRQLVARARAAGVETISLDLIFAAPGQSLQSLEVSLDAALALEVDHLSCYGLTIEEGTPFEQVFLREPEHFISDDMAADLYASLIEKLEAAGFEQYELSNFARAGRRCRHNENYWADGEYLGFGVGAASFWQGRRWVNARSLDVYCHALEQGEMIPRESEALQGAARWGEAVMLALRRREGVNIVEFERRYHMNFLEYYEQVILEYCAANLLEQVDDTLRLTARGKPLANEVCAAFLVMPERVR